MQWKDSTLDTIFCRALIDESVEIVNARTGRMIENYEFAVHDDPPQNALLRLRLDEAALQRKIDAAMAYREIRHEVQESLDRLGRQSFAVESLRPSSAQAMMERFNSIPPQYETLGEDRVRDGRYRQVIRYRDHLRPVFGAMGVS
ncbi:MAG: hypothetical protein ACRD3J_31165, partial [Thermoanaerobaculia bacterium]